MTQRVIYPVSDSPAEDGRYLVHYLHGGTLMAWYEADEDQWYSDVFLENLALGFTHWEELPEFDQTLVVGGGN